MSAEPSAHDANPSSDEGSDDGRMSAMAKRGAVIGLVFAVTILVGIGAVAAQIYDDHENEKSAAESSGHGADDDGHADDVEGSEHDTDEG